MAVKLVPFLFQTVVAVPMNPVIVPTSQSPEVVLVPLPETHQAQAPLAFFSILPSCVSRVEA